LQILANNNAADSDHSQGASSAEWKAINGSDGSLITPNGSGTTSGSVKLRWDTNHFKWTTTSTADGTTDYKNCAFESIVADSSIGTNATLLLQALALLKYDNTAGAYAGDNFYARTYEAERSFYRGGYYSHSAAAGVFFGFLASDRGNQDDSLGFRSAFVNLPAA
jgi:hypothetical protein